MRTANIHTAQNVIISFQVASLGQRALAYLMDLFIMIAGVLVINLFMAAVFYQFSYLGYLVIAFYTPTCEILLNGQTLGKRAMKLRVMNVKGKEPVTLDYIIRWAFRFIDLYLSFYSEAVVLSSTSPRGQRLGGILSNTMVVSLRSEMDLSLSDILRIEDRSNYQPQYEEVYRFSEEEMLTIKSLIDRQNRYKNSTYQSLISEAAEKCASVLRLSKIPRDRVSFLKTILRDYIVITRS